MTIYQSEKIIKSERTRSIILLCATLVFYFAAVMTENIFVSLFSVLFMCISFSVTSTFRDWDEQITYENGILSIRAYSKRPEKILSLKVLAKGNHYLLNKTFVNPKDVLIHGNTLYLTDFYKGKPYRVEVKLTHFAEEDIRAFSSYLDNLTQGKEN